MQRRTSRRSAVSSVLLSVAMLVGSTTVAVAIDPSPSTTPGTSTPATSAPPTTRPATTVPGSTTSAPPSSTSTTSTTTPRPTTTLGALPPDGGTGGGGYAATPAPLIPSASSDPLFNAALTVDADLRTLSQRKIDYLTAIAKAARAKERAATEAKAYGQVRDVDRQAVKHLGNAESILQAAALHAYAGYGASQTSVATSELQGSETVLPYRTYVRVTISDASRQVEQARAARARSQSDAQAAAARNQRFQQAADQATSAEEAAKKAIEDAEEKLARDRAVLAERISAMPDLAPGTLDELPDTAELPPGAMPVETPVGTIVVPAKADPRTAVALQFIVAQMGKPYLWGGTGPNAYDCSGLMLRAFQAAGVTSMPRVSQAQQVWATPVEAKDVQPGDLVFFGRPAYHVGVYIGGGLMIDAPYTGSHVRVDRVWSSVTGYGRVVWSTPPPTAPPVPES